MFLWGHRARLEGEIERQLAIIRTLEDQIEKVFDLVSTIQSEKEAILQAHRETIDLLKESQRRLEQAQSSTPVYLQPRNLHMSEEEEDLQWQAAHGMVDKREVEALVEELGLENTEIHFDSP